MKILITLFTAFLFLQFTSIAQSTLDSNLTLHSYYPMGMCNSGYVDGEYAYVSFDIGMDILDMSVENFYSTINPRKIGRISWDNRIKVKKVEGDYAYLVNEDEELMIVDIRNPYYPLEINSFYIGEGVFSYLDGDVFILNSHAYVYSADSTLKIIDVTDPHNPQLLGNYSLDYRMRSYYVAGNYLYSISVEYVAYDSTFNTLHILDISTPSNISEVGSIEIICSEVIADVFVSGSYAYLPGWSPGFPGVSSPLRIIDVANPSNPNIIGAITDSSFWGASSIFVKDNYAYMSEIHEGVAGTKIHIADVSNPANPFKISDFWVWEKGLLSNVVNDYAYILSRFGMTLLDISDPFSPSYAGFYDTGYEFANIQISGNYLFMTSSSTQIIGGLSDRRDFKVFDVSNKTNPIEIASHLLEHLPTSLIIAGDYLFTVSSDVYSNHNLGNLEIINISNPAYPQTAGIFKSDSTSFFDIDIEGSNAFILGANYGSPHSQNITVLDVSNPSIPNLKSFYNITDDIEWFGKQFLENSYLYFFTRNGNRILNVVDATDPLNLILAGTFDTESNNYASGLFIKDNFAYFLQDSLLKILDVRVPSSITSVSSYHLGISNGSLYVEGVFAYITNSAGIKIIDVANPLNPIAVGFTTLTGYPGDLVVQNGIIHLISSTKGLYILGNDLATSVFTDLDAPDKYNLSYNYPNPFNPSTKIKYSIPQASLVQIKVFDVLGNEIEKLINEEKPSGTYELTWYAEHLPSGVYFYQLKAGDFIETKKMILIK